MEGLAAFALACNVLQIISTGGEAIKICREIYKEGSSFDNQELHRRSELIARPIQTIQTWFDSFIASGRQPLSATEAQLWDVATKCLAIARELQNKLQELKQEPGDGRRTLIKKSAKTWWQKSPIQKMEQNLTKYEAILQTSILTHMSREQAMFILDTCDRFSSLDDSLKRFIQKFADGQSKISDLITQEANDTRHAITTSSEITRSHIDNGFNTSRNERAIESGRERLLQSLYFDNSNARRNDIDEVYKGTFEWAFRGEIEAPWSSVLGYLQDDQKVYWVQGKPGSGKSSLMKFIYEDPRTEQTLCQWKTGRKALMLSFFFWLSGTELQCSLKGLWSSLLYQLLSQDVDLLDRLQRREPARRVKNALADWSVQELFDTFFWATECQRAPLFILIDGLDEFNHPEGPTKIIRYIKALCSLPDIKLLLSSRPEIELEREIRHTFPCLSELKLQDITRYDIATYAHEYLRDAVHIRQFGIVSEQQISSLAETAVQKAEGVFLWVRYALRSLIYGVKSCSTWDELQRHLNTCPGEIESLYQQMWARLNPEEELYKEETAWYFHILLSPDLHDLFKESPDSVRCLWPVQRNILRITLARSKDLQERLLEKEGQVTLAELVQLCNTTVNRIAARCAGLLEVSKGRDAWHWSGWEFEGALEESALADTTELGKYFFEELKFIHRSARDFMLNNPAGQRILNVSNPFPQSAWCLTFNRANMVALLVAPPYLFSLEELLRPIEQLCRQGAPAAVHVPAMQTIASTLRICQNEKRSMEHKELNIWNAKFSLDGDCLLPLYSVDGVLVTWVDLLGYAAYRGLKMYVQAFVERSRDEINRTYLEYLLLCASAGCITDEKQIVQQSGHELIWWLLDLNANVNQTYCAQVWDDSDNYRGSLLTTSFTLFLQKSFHYGLGLVARWSTRVTTLGRFIDAGANLQERFVFGIGHSHSYGFEAGFKALFMFERVDDLASGTMFVVEMTAVSFLQTLQAWAWPPSTADVDWTSYDGFRKVHLIRMGERLCPVNDTDSDLVLAAFDRFVKDIGRRESNEEKWNFEISLWEEHVEPVTSRILLRNGFSENKKKAGTELREWLIDHGWMLFDDDRSKPRLPFDKANLPLSGEGQADSDS